MTALERQAQFLRGLTMLMSPSSKLSAQHDGPIPPAALDAVRRARPSGDADDLAESETLARQCKDEARYCIGRCRTQPGRFDYWQRQARFQIANYIGYRRIASSIRRRIEKHERDSALLRVDLAAGLFRAAAE